MGAETEGKVETCDPARKYSGGRGEKMNIPVSTLEAIYRRLSRQHYSCSSERANSPGDDASSAEWKFEIMKPASVLATCFGQ